MTAQSLDRKISFFSAFILIVNLLNINMETNHFLKKIKKIIFFLAISFAATAIQAQTTYYITGSGTSFTARKDNAITGAIVNGANGVPIQNVIDAIKTRDDCTIQFGSGGANVLDIGTAYINFDDNGSNETTRQWGKITLTGKITSNSSIGTIHVTRHIRSIDSYANIKNTSDTGKTIFIETISSSRKITISGGSVEATAGDGIFNFSSNTVDILGGVVSVTTGDGVHNGGYGKINITGGTVSATTGKAIFNPVWGDITITGTAIITSESTSTTSGTVHNDGDIEITGGTVRNTATGGNAVYNSASGGISISDGTVEATASGYAILNAKGTLSMSGTPKISGKMQ